MDYPKPFNDCTKNERIDSNFGRSCDSISNRTPIIINHLHSSIQCQPFSPGFQGPPLTLIHPYPNHHLYLSYAFFYIPPLSFIPLPCIAHYKALFTFNIISDMVYRAGKHHGGCIPSLSAFLGKIKCNTTPPVVARQQPDRVRVVAITRDKNRISLCYKKKN